MDHLGLSGLSAWINGCVTVEKGSCVFSTLCESWFIPQYIFRLCADERVSACSCMCALLHTSLRVHECGLYVRLVHQEDDLVRLRHLKADGPLAKFNGSLATVAELSDRLTKRERRSTSTMCTWGMVWWAKDSEKRGCSLEGIQVIWSKKWQNYAIPHGCVPCNALSRFRPIDVMHG